MNTVIVTGAASGIGRETAKRFARQGDHVIIADIDEDGARAAAAEIESAGGIATAYRLDVTSEEQWNDFGDWVKHHYSAPQVLVNNAGVMDVGGFVDTTPEQWQRMIDINLMSVVYGCRVFARQMIDAGVRGHIVNLSSMAAYMPSKLEPAYGVAKAAVLMASSALRNELRSNHIGVTAICPGVIRTNLLVNGERAGLTETEREQWKSGAAAAQAALAPTQPDAVARAILKAVRKNSAIVPVTVEARLGYLISRVSPSLMAGIAQAVSLERFDALLGRFGSLLGDAGSTRKQSNPQLAHGAITE